MGIAYRGRGITRITISNTVTARGAEGVGLAIRSDGSSFDGKGSGRSIQVCVDTKLC
jgi:hypothetical protein